MGLDLSAFHRMMPGAIELFWSAREAASAAQSERGVFDQGSRSGVTAGKNLDGFSRMVEAIVRDNGIPKTAVFTRGKYTGVIPGFFRPTKNWDLLVVRNNRLLAAIEFKSQVGSFSNNFNNRVEEAIGNATDLLTAFREEAFGDAPKPFLGYVFVLEDSPESTRPVKIISPHFRAMREFTESSYAERYDLLCQKLVHEQLYDAAALILTKPTGEYRSLSQLTSIDGFVAQLAGRMAALAAL